MQRYVIVRQAEVGPRYLVRNDTRKRDPQWTDNIDRAEKFRSEDAARQRAGEANVFDVSIEEVEARTIETRL